jgi:hypothetical protein
MHKDIEQRVDFPGVSARVLFRTYLSSEHHSAAVGAPASIAPHVGGRFRVFGENGLSGTTLAIIEDHLVVQRWRGQLWKPEDVDSTLILLFEDTPEGAAIRLTQINIPEQAYEMVNPEAWQQIYWSRWRRHFSRTASADPALSEPRS